MLGARDILLILFTIGFFVSGTYLNFLTKNQQVQKIKQSNDHSLLLFRLIIPIALGLSLFFHFFTGAGKCFIEPLMWTGVVLVIFGFALRIVAVRQLGKAFQVQVSIIEGQQLVKSGVYRYLRHPSYTGMLLYYFGMVLIIQQWVAFLLLTFGPLVVILIRINQEEKFLQEHFQEEYYNYSKQSWKLIAFIY